MFALFWRAMLLDVKATSGCYSGWRSKFIPSNNSYRDIQSITHTKRLLRFVSEASPDRTSCFDCVSWQIFQLLDSKFCFCFYSLKYLKTWECFCVWIHLNLKVVQILSTWKLHTGSCLWVFAYASFFFKFLSFPFFPTSYSPQQLGENFIDFLICVNLCMSILLSLYLFYCVIANR